MAASTLTALLLSLLVSPTLATLSLSIAVSGPSSVDGLSGLKLATTLHNTGDEALRLLNDPQSVLAPHWETDVFSISRVNGSGWPEFDGVMVKWSPSLAAEGGNFTLIEPGQSVEFTHDLSTRYDFTNSGEGTYDFHALDIFTHIDSTGNLVSLHGSQNSPVSVKISGDLAAIPSMPSSAKFAKRARFMRCSSAQQAQLSAAIPAAQRYAANALSYLERYRWSTSRYTTWFGRYNSNNLGLVTSHFRAISGGQFSSFTYDCSCTDAGTYAFVNPNKYGYINLCGAFWRAPVTGTDSKGGTLVHECSHFTRNGGTQDYAYGQSACRRLAQTNPARAVMNADSHEYFAESS